MTAIEPVELRTPRLLLRRPSQGDLDDIYAIFSDAEVARYGSKPAWTSPEEARQWLARADAGYAEGASMVFAIEQPPSHTVIGTCTLHQFHHGCRRAEIGYALGRTWWRQGFMDEALHAMVDHAFGALDLRRLEADIDPANTASSRSLQRLGFVHEGRLRERWEVEGHITDSDVFGLLRSEWRTDRRSR